VTVRVTEIEIEIVRVTEIEIEIVTEVDMIVVNLVI
jgi:hypothetical protein